MPTPFFHKNQDTGELEEVTYWDAKESAAHLHVSLNYLRKQCRTKRWPHLNSVGHYYLNADHITWIIEAQTHDPDQVQAPPKAGPLGVVMNQEELAELEDVQ